MTTILEVADDIYRATGKHPLTPRWEATLRAFYGLSLRDVDVTNLQRATRRAVGAIWMLSGTGRAMRELWSRVGRRGRKSFVAALIGIFEACFGGHESYLVDGERGLVAVISKDTAGSTLVARFAELHAKALGIKSNWTTIGSVRVLELEGFAFGIACFPCNAKAPRGYAIAVIIADEIAHWATDDAEYINSDEAVLGAIKPAMAQFPSAKLIAISSPLGRAGLHFKNVDDNLGDDADANVLAVEGPTWEWNPEITEARTREIEKDPETHQREFGAIPSDTEGTAFNQADVPIVFQPQAGHFAYHPPIVALDPASSSNTFAGVVAQMCEPSAGTFYEHEKAPARTGLSPDVFVGLRRNPNGALVKIPKPERPVLYISRVFGWSGEELRQTTMDVVAAEIAGIAAGAGARTIVSDQHADVYLAALLARHGARLRSFHQTQRSKHEAVTFLRMLMRDRQLVSVEHEGMKKDLETYPRRIVGGGFKYGERRAGHHWDYASALVILAHSFIETEPSPTDTYLAPVEGNPAKRHHGGRYIGGAR